MSGQVVAMYYFYKFRDTVYLMQSGFDPDFSDVKPGQVLLGYIVEHAIGEHHKVLDFLKGDHRYKDELATGERETMFVTAFRLRPGAFVYRLRRMILPALKARLREVAARVRPPAQETHAAGPRAAARRRAAVDTAGGDLTMASALKRLLVQTSHYSFSSLLTMVAGLISFPVLTHVLPVADYGVLSLISATLTIGVALGKTGLQHSIIRFQSEVAEGKSAYTRAQLYSTTVFGMTGASLVVTVLLLIGIQVLAGRGGSAAPSTRGRSGWPRA